MGCFGSRGADLNKLISYFGSALTYADAATAYSQDARVHWNLFEYPEAIDDLITGLSKAANAVKMVLGRYESFYPEYGLIHFLSAHTIESAEVDMSAILLAMHNAEPHQPLLFMGYLEAYKASVWNATFDELFFADLVKKWMIWG